MEKPGRSMVRLILFLALFGSMTRADEISFAALSHLAPHDVVLLGEVHDNPRHHLGQAAVIAALKPRAVVFEMLSPAQVGRITPSLLRDPAALQQALDWNASGWPDFAMYYPIFKALGRARIYGAARPRAEVRRAFHVGAAAVFGPQAARFGLDRPLPKTQQDTREAAQFQDHCEAMSRNLMGGMVEAQRLRDADLARIALRALDDTDGPVVVIAGKGHVRRDWGVPAVLRVANPGLDMQTIGFLEQKPETAPPFDLWVVTRAQPREDPCRIFAKSGSG